MVGPLNDVFDIDEESSFELDDDVPFPSVVGLADS
jgi:hypothetical protein